MLIVPAPYTPIKQVRFTTSSSNRSSPSPTHVLQNEKETVSKLSTSTSISASPVVGQRYQLKPATENDLRSCNKNNYLPEERIIPSGMPLAPMSPIKSPQRNWRGNSAPASAPLSPMKSTTFAHPHTPTAAAPSSFQNSQKLCTMSVDRVGATKRPSLPVVPHMVPLSPLVSSTAKSTAPLNHARDNKYAFSKVFQTRYNAAATTLQKNVRMVQACQQLNARRRVALETAEARRLARERYQKQVEAAVRIQALARRWRTRLHLRVYQLEHQLTAIQRTKQCELQAIADWKRETHAAMQSEYQALVSQDDEQERLNQDTLDKANHLIRYLRKVNARQRIKNDTLQAAIDQLLAENQMLNEEAARYANFRDITQTMSKACTNKTVLMEVLREFESKKEAMESAIERRDDRIMFENRVGRLYLNAVRNMVFLLETSSTDDRLVYTVEAMCLELEEKGFGLEASEYENSKVDIAFNG